METEKNIAHSAPIDCSGDGGVMKVIIPEGFGDEFPLKDQEVDITYVGTF